MGERAMTESASVVLTIDATVTSADVAALSWLLVELLRTVPGAQALCDVAAVTQPDLETVNALARLQMRARAIGAPIRLCNASGRLRELVELAGLGTVLPSLEDGV
jgi:ABC-type transporter Mla MlaB component